MILFDETEQMLAAKSQQARTLAANLLRRLIDGSTAGRLRSTFVGFAVLPGTVEQAALVYPALGQRYRVIERTDGGYRRPVLEITHLNSCRIPTQFLEEAVDHILTLARLNSVTSLPACVPGYSRTVARCLSRMPAAIAAHSSSSSRRPRWPMSDTALQPIDWEGLASHGHAPSAGCRLLGVGYEDASRVSAHGIWRTGSSRGQSAEKFIVGPFGSGKTPLPPPAHGGREGLRVRDFRGQAEPGPRLHEAAGALCGR